MDVVEDFCGGRRPSAPCPLDLDVTLTFSSDSNNVLTTLDALAKELISLKTDGKVWIGSDSTNVVKVLLDLIGVVKTLAKATAEHTHKGKTVPAPDNAADFTQQESQAGTLSSELSPLTP